ncbi:MAG: metallophosphoesterase [Firmicutes bacterium]|nr:metallophosphoesterase [Bacillota bacterium]
MSIFAIADPHLSIAVDKPMDLFGGNWERHTERLAENWRAVVEPEDTVLVGGDLSWGLTFEEAKPDLDFLHELPGRKILFKGNHDLWWRGITRLNRLYDDMVFVQNTAVAVEDVVVAGTRGWNVPGSADWEPHDEKIYVREVQRLEMSLKAARRLSDAQIIVQLHFPPFSEQNAPTGFTELCEAYGVSTVLYGHVHGGAAQSRLFRGERNGITYYNVACDYLNCMPKKVR